MKRPSRRAFGLIALLLLAPLLSVVVICTLLLFGADPHSVFLPGHLAKSTLESLGIHVPNAVGVLTTVIAWWAIIVLVWLVLRRVWRTAPAGRRG